MLKGTTVQRSCSTTQYFRQTEYEICNMHGGEMAGGDLVMSCSSNSKQYTLDIERAEKYGIRYQ